MRHKDLTGLFMDDHPQYVRKDGTRPLQSDWDAGSYTITAQGIDVTDIDFSGQLTSTVATGTAPFVIASTTVNTNLNADLVDGINANTTATASQLLALDADKDFDLGTGDFSGTDMALTGNIDVSGTSQLDGNVTIGDGTADTDYTLTFNGETNDGVLTWMEDEDYFLIGDDFVLSQPVYDDVRVTASGFDRVGVADPALVSYTPTGSSIATYLYEWQVDDIAYLQVQLPHRYQEGQDISVHVHWTPGLRGNEESGATVGWKVDYTWANINGAFGAMATADLSDACDGTDDKHQMTPTGTITGTSKNISSMLICNIKRTDTGTDDTWAGTLSGQLPMILEVDFHFPIDSMGSRDWGTK